MGTGSFPGVKRPGRGADHPPPSSTEVEGRVELYICSPSGPSWPVLGWTLRLIKPLLYRSVGGLLTYTTYLILKIGWVCYPETSVSKYQTTSHNIRENFSATVRTKPEVSCPSMFENTVAGDPHRFIAVLDSYWLCSWFQQSLMGRDSSVGIATR